MSFQKTISSLLMTGCLFLVACGSTSTQNERADSGVASNEMNIGVDVPVINREEYANIHAVPDDSKQIVETPLDRYVHSEDEVTQIVAANFFPFKKCVNDAGYETSHHFYETEYRPDVPFGVWSRSYAEKYGYAINRAKGKVYLDQGDSSEDPGRDKIQTECLAKTAGDEIPVLMRGVSARPVGDLVILSEVSGQIQVLMNEDEDIKAAVQEWIQCLNDQGIPMDSQYEQHIPVIPDDKEANIKQALVDVQCKQDVRLMERYFDAQAQYEQALIEKNQAAFNTLAERKEAYLNQAREVLIQNGITP